MNTMFENSHASESPAVSLETVLRTATTSLGVPEWFAAHWHRQMCMMGWVNKSGRAIYAKNWQRNLLQWWKWANFKKGKCVWGARHPVGDAEELTPSLTKRLTLTRSLASRGAGTSNEKLLKRPKHFVSIGVKFCATEVPRYVRGWRG